MTMYQCPKCELRFELRTILDDHCRNDHPEFHHDYPVGHSAHSTTPARNGGGSAEHAERRINR